MLRNYTYSIIFYFWIFFLIKTFFYFNSNYEKSPFIIDPKRKFVETPYDFEKYFNFRNEQRTAHLRDALDDQEELPQVLLQKKWKWKKNEVLDYPFVWQPDIVDEGDDWRYRKSAYLKKPVLRIIMHYRHEISNYSDFQKGLIFVELFIFFILMPFTFIWLFINRWELFFIYFENTILSDYLINFIGLEESTLYSILVRLYYQNTINQITDELVSKTSRVNGYIWNLGTSGSMHVPWDDDPITYAPEAYQFDYPIGFKYNFKLTGTRYSLERIPVRKGVHNFNLVTNLILDYEIAYNKKELDTFILKEILLELKWKQQIQQQVVEDAMHEKTTYLTRFFDWFYRSARRGSNPCPGFWKSLLRRRHCWNWVPFKKEEYYTRTPLALWAWNNNVYLEGDVWLHYAWTNYYTKWPRMVISEGTLNNIEAIRDIEIKRFYFSDFIVWCVTRIYYKFFQIRKDSYIWIILNFIKGLKETTPVTFVSKLISDLGILAWYRYEFKASLDNFVYSLRISKVGRFMFLNSSTVKGHFSNKADSSVTSPFYDCYWFVRGNKSNLFRSVKTEMLKSSAMDEYLSCIDHNDKEDRFRSWLNNDPKKILFFLVWQYIIEIPSKIYNDDRRANLPAGNIDNYFKENYVKYVGTYRILPK